MPAVKKKCKAWTLKIRVHSTVADQWPQGKVRIDGAVTRPATLQQKYTFTKFTQQTSGLAKLHGRRKGTVTLTVSFEEDDGTWAQVGTVTAEVDEGQVVSATIDIRPHELRVILVDLAGQPLENYTWSLTAPVQANGTTGGNGLIEVNAFPVAAKTGAMTTTPPAAAPALAAAPAAPLGDPPPYPPPIVPAQFEDAEPTAPANAGRVDWTLKLGDLGAGAGGVFTRLHNFGYAGDGKASHRLAGDTVKSYQATVLGQANGSGVATDIENHITPRHDEA